MTGICSTVTVGVVTSMAWAGSGSVEEAQSSHSASCHRLDSDASERHCLTSFHTAPLSRADLIVLLFVTTVHVLVGLSVPVRVRCGGVPFPFPKQRVAQLPTTSIYKPLK